MGSRESPGLFSWKSRSPRGCNRRRDAPEDAGPAICESRVAPGWYGPIPATWYRAISAPKDFEKPCVRPVALGVKRPCRPKSGDSALIRRRLREVWLGHKPLFSPPARAGVIKANRTGIGGPKWAAKLIRVVTYWSLIKQKRLWLHSK